MLQNGADFYVSSKMIYTLLKIRAGLTDKERKKPEPENIQFLAPSGGCSFFTCILVKNHT